MSTERDAARHRHPAGKRAAPRRPGVRMVELPVEPAAASQQQATVCALECLTCGALLMVGSPNAVHHVATHRGPRWRRALRDARIRARKLLTRRNR